MPTNRASASGTSSRSWEPGTAAEDAASRPATGAYRPLSSRLWRSGFQSVMSHIGLPQTIPEESEGATQEHAGAAGSQSVLAEEEEEGEEEEEPENMDIVLWESATASQVLLLARDS